MRGKEAGLVERCRCSRDWMRNQTQPTNEKRSKRDPMMAREKSLLDILLLLLPCTHLLSARMDTNIEFKIKISSPHCGKKKKKKKMMSHSSYISRFYMRSHETLTARPQHGTDSQQRLAIRVRRVTRVTKSILVSFRGGDKLQSLINIF